MLYICGVFCVQALLLSYLCSAQADQQILTAEAPLRKATLDDADNIATIVMAAFEPMPDWQYFRQFRHQFPEGHRECVRYGVTQMLTHPNTNTEVIEAPDGSTIPLVAMATWSEHQIPSMLSVLERDAPSKCVDRNEAEADKRKRAATKVLISPARWITYVNSMLQNTSMSLMSLVNRRYTSMS